MNFIKRIYEDWAIARIDKQTMNKFFGTPLTRENKRIIGAFLAEKLETYRIFKDDSKETFFWGVFWVMDKWRWPHGLRKDAYMEIRKTLTPETRQV